MKKLINKYQIGGWFPKPKYPKYNPPMSDTDDGTWLKWWYDNREYQLKLNNATGIQNYIEPTINAPIKFYNEPKSFLAGMAAPDTIYINIPNANYDDNLGRNTLLHERTHYLNGASTHDIYNEYFDEYIPPIYKSIKNIEQLDPYLDNPNEIYSRLMEFRRVNRLNPKDIINKKDINKWRKNKTLELYHLDRYNDETLLHLFNDIAENNQLEMINYSKRGSKLIKKCLNGERVNMSRLVTNSEGTPLKVDNNLLEELDNFLIKQNVGLPLRLAILYTVVQEGSTTGSHGNGAYGYLGWRGSRIPGKGVNLMLYLYDTIFGEFNKDLWNHGGVGSGYMSGREAQQSFINATNVNDALRSLNYGYVRPELELREFRSKTKYFNEDEEVN